MVATVGIHKARPSMPGHGVHQVYPRQRKAVFRTGVVEVDVINAHPPLPIFLLNHNRVRQPLGVLDILYGTGLQESVNLFNYSVGVLRSRPSSFLHNWFSTYLNVEFVADKLLVDARHFI